MPAEIQVNWSDNELLLLLRAGNQEALEVLYERQQGNVYRFVLQMCGSRALAEDITQEVFLVLIRDNHSYNPARGSLKAFLLGVARNKLLRRLQRERIYASINEESDGISGESDSLTAKCNPLEVLSRTEAIESIRRAVMSLPDHYREVVVLCELQEMSYEEAAAIIGCALGTVRSRLHRARSLLIEKLQPSREADEISQAVRTARCFA
jgi:RNA polymerase sigma-70 factor, ECF subfamily